MSKYEKIDQPAHYQGDGMTVMEIIEAYDLNFAVGNVIKYMLRAGKKPGEEALEDLSKAAWYLQAEIDRRTKRAVTESNQEATVTAHESLTVMGRRESAGEWGAVTIPSSEPMLLDHPLAESIKGFLVPEDAITKFVASEGQFEEGPWDSLFNPERDD